jgi:hypothetical protein
MPPRASTFVDAELRFLLRIVDETSNPEIPPPLRDWEVDNLAEIVNVNLATLDTEIREFHDGTVVALGRGGTARWLPNPRSA